MSPKKKARLSKGGSSSNSNSSTGAGKNETKKVCVVCKKSSTFRCGKCSKVKYCSRECQREHWKTHKKQCKPVVVEAKDDEEEEKENVEEILLHYEETQPRKFVAPPNMIFFDRLNGKCYPFLRPEYVNLPPRHVYTMKLQLAKNVKNCTCQHCVVGLPVLIYDKIRSFERLVSSTNPAYPALVKMIRKFSNAGQQKMYAKGYFDWASSLHLYTKPVLVNNPW